MQRKRLDVVKRVVAIPCSCEVVRPSVPFVRFVLVLQMQHLRGIHTYREEASRLWTARSARSSRHGCRMGSGGCQKAWIDLPCCPPHIFIGVPNELPSWRPISNPKPCLIRIQSELGFQPLKHATLWVHAHIDMARVLLLGH